MPIWTILDGSLKALEGSWRVLEGLGWGKNLNVGRVLEGFWEGCWGGLEGVLEGSWRALELIVRPGCRADN